MPTDPLAAYESKGISSRLSTYYNPLGTFDEVICLSPFEWERRQIFGMTVEPCTALNFKNKLLDISPSLVRVYGGGLACEIAMSGKGADIPIVVSVHDLHPSLMKAALRKADYVLAVSAAVRSALIRMGIPNQRIKDLPNRVDLERFRPESEIATIDNPHATYEILHLGRKSHQKNLDNVIRALAHLPSHYTLTAAGPGDASSYERLAKELNVSNRVRLIGAIPNSDLPDVIRKSACLCNPSRWEGFGLVFLEALACGIPVIARGCAPASELIVDRVSGILVQDIAKPEQIAEAITQACENRALRERLRHTGPQVARKYSLALQSRAEVNIYQQIMSEHERRGIK